MILLFACFLFFILTRIYPYFFTSVPLGYDSGLYLYLFKQYSHLSFFSYTSLPDWLIGMGQLSLPAASWILTKFISPEKLVIPFIIVSQIFLFVAVYLLAKKLWGSKTALWVIFIFACSAIQFHFYWYYYLRNIFALSFLLLAISYLRSRSYWSILFSVLVFYTHQQTAAFLLVLLFFWLLTQKKERKYYLRVLAATLILGGSYYLLTFHQILSRLIEPIVKGFIPQSLGGSLGIPSGSFYDLPQAFLLSLPYLIFSILGLKQLKSQKNFIFIFVPMLACLVIVVLRLYFSRRFLPFLDLFFILPAGYWLAGFFGRRKVLGFFYAAFMVLFIGTYVYKTSQPLILNDELREIKMLTETEPESYVLVTDNEYTPWVFGWSDRKPITPGYGQYDLYWTSPQWQEFWSGDKNKQKGLLLKLPQPLYIFHGDKSSMFEADFTGDGFERINWRTWKFNPD